MINYTRLEAQINMVQMKRMHHRPVRLQKVAWFVVAALAGFLLAVQARPVWAHGEVVAGDYLLEIGWVNEPVLVGQPNALFLYITPAEAGETGEEEGEHGDEEHGHAAGVTGAEATLNFTVEYGGVSRRYQLVPVLGQAGQYTAAFIPTREGQYTFHFTGAINGQDINLSFEPEEVESAGDHAFPEAALSPAEQASQLAAAQSQARTALMVAIVAVVLGLAGAGLGIYGLTRRR
jgi:hypothetical protein